MAAILRYNNSVAYARNVLGWAAAYATGVVPVDLPPITGPVPPLGDAHLDQYEGLGPGLPLNALGLPSTDPLALMPLMVNGDVASQLYPGQSLGPLPGPAPAYVPSAPQTEQPTAPPWQPPWMQQQAPEPQRPPQCAVFCITNPPAAPAHEALPTAPGEAQTLMPQAPPAGPASTDEPAGVLPPATGPAPGPAPGAIG
jgi:hypothetical protein